MSAKLVRVGGGLAALTGGVIGVIASLIALVFLPPRALSVLPQPLPQNSTEMPSSGIITLTGLLLILAWVLVLGGLVGLYASRQEALGVLGVVGLAWALVGTVLFVGLLCLQTFYIPTSGVAHIGIVVRIVAGGVELVTSVGWFLFGVAVLRARIYPPPAAVLLMVGALINAFIYLTGGEFIVLAAVIAWLGFLLLRGRGKPMEKSARVRY